MRPIFDQAWRERALGGDPGAVRLLADEALAPLYGFVLYRVDGDRHLAEEVVQETLLQGIKRLASYDPARGGDRVFGWLSGLARNEIRRLRRPSHRSVSLDALWERMDHELLAVFAKLEQAPFGQDVLERKETRTVVNATMSQLPAQYRAALEAKYVSGLSTREIAGRLAITEKAVESQLGRARKAFRATFLALTRNLGAEPSL